MVILLVMVMVAMMMQRGLGEEVPGAPGKKGSGRWRLPKR
jgi:hypothetical protein